MWITDRYGCLGSVYNGKEIILLPREFFTVTCHLRDFKIDFFLTKVEANLAQQNANVMVTPSKIVQKRVVFEKSLFFPNKKFIFLKLEKTQLLFQQKLTKRENFGTRNCKKCFRRHLKGHFFWNVFPNSWKAENIPVLAKPLVSERNGNSFWWDVFVQLRPMNLNMEK